MTAHPIRAGLILGATAWAVLIAAILIDELRLAQRQKRLAVQGVSAGSAVRWAGTKAAPAGASTPSGGLTAPLDASERTADDTA